MEKSARLSWILDSWVIAIVHVSSPDGLIEATGAMISGDVSVVESVLNKLEVLFLIKSSWKRFGPRALIGVGAVLTKEGVQDSLDAGAQFIIMPTLNREVMDYIQGEDVPIISGLYTPTEVYSAWKGDADLAKLFPASAGDLSYVMAIQGPLPEVRPVPTGGVSVDSAGDYIHAGVVAVAVGMNLVSGKLIAASRFGELARAACQLSTIVKKAQK